MDLAGTTVWVQAKALTIWSTGAVMRSQCGRSGDADGEDGEDEVKKENGEKEPGSH